MGDMVSLQALICPYFQLREKFRYIEHNIGKSKTQLNNN